MGDSQTTRREWARGGEGKRAIPARTAKANSFAPVIDYAHTFASVTDIALTTLADACFIDMLGDGGKIRRTAAAYRDSAKVDKRAHCDDRKDLGAAWVIRTGRSLVYPAAEGISRSDDPRHIKLIRELFKSAMVVPMQARGKTLGAITFAREERGRPYTSADLVSAEDLAHRAALAIDNANLFQQARKELEERRRAEARLRFLAEASRRLDEALDYPAALECAARLATSNLADWCLIDMLDDEGILRREFTATADPVKTSLAQERERRCPPRPDLNDLLKNAVVTGDSSLYAEIPRNFLRQQARDAEHLRMMEALALKSLMIAPMRARSRILGVISFLSAESGRRYGPEDLAMAEDLAHRAALAIESALLLRESREAVQARDEFISVASHELKTPLTALQLHVESLMRFARRAENKALPVEPMMKSLDAVARQGDRLTRLINGLLDLTRIRAGKLALEHEEVDISLLTRSVVDRLAEDLVRSGSTMTLRADEPIVGRWDRKRIERSITNLYANTIKYGNGKPIEVSVEARNGDARLVFRDQGIGISPQDLKRLFTPFERASSAKHFGGLGLGLYIARQIVEAHGGSVYAASEEGAGTTFVVELPRNPGE